MSAPRQTGPRWADTVGRVQLGAFVLALFAGSFSVAIGQIGLGLALLAALVRWVGARQGPPVTGLEKVTLLFVGWAVLMIPLSTAPGQSLVFSRRFFLFTALWLGAALAGDEGRRRLLAGALLAGAAGVSLVGAVAAWRELGGLFVDRMDRVSNAMTSGAVLMIVLLLAVGLLLVRGLSRRERLAVGAAALPIALGLLMTMTRSALLGVAAGTGLMLLLARPRWFAVFAGLGLAALVALVGWGDHFLSPRMQARLDPEFFVSGVNTTGRVEMWRTGWRLVRDHPITGVGDRDLQELAEAYRESPDQAAFGHMHSNPVHLAVIWGVPGLALALVFLGRQAQLVWRRWRRDGGRTTTDAPWRRGWRLGALGVWTGFFVAGLTEWYFGDAEPMLLFMAVLGIALGPAARAAAPADPNRTGAADG